jgi:hypothetical protein
MEWSATQSVGIPMRTPPAHPCASGAVGTGARGVIFNAVSAVIVIIDEGYDPDAPDSAPGWTLVETGSDGNATGRQVVGLHESLLDVDPNGVEAADFW